VLDCLALSGAILAAVGDRRNSFAKDCPRRPAFGQLHSNRGIAVALQTDDSEETVRLLKAAASGEQAAFEELFARHRPYLRRVVGRRLDRQLVQRLDWSDVVQDAQLDAFRQLPSYLARRPMPFRLWLFKTAHQRVAKVHRQHLRAARRDLAREFALPDRSSVQLANRLIDRQASPSDQVDRAERASQLRRVLGQLPERDREVILLRNLDGLSNQDAAAVLEIEPETAKKRYARWLVRLEQLLRELGFSRSDP
jgi:RNA polymerase sigma-70 factor (ECF subfamily)